MHSKNLITSGILFSLILFLWPMFMAIAQPSGTDAEKLAWVMEHLVLYRLQFIFALLIAPSIIFMMGVHLSRLDAENSLATRLGLIFITCYAVLVSIAYGSQMVAVPLLLQAGLTEQAGAWFLGSSYSISYFINQLGYFFWGLGTLILYWRFMRQSGIIKYLSIIMVASASLSVVAFTGLVIDSEAVNSTTLYSGLLLIPTGILTIIWGYREHLK